jgi:glycosyltransferase involved in cell wall biosynthesis
MALAAHPVWRAHDDGGALVFGAVLNPADLRKNVLNLIEGFLAANAEVNNRDLLVLKLVIPNRGDFRAGNIFDELFYRGGGGLAYFEDSVLVVVDYLDGEEMGCFYDLLDYYLCASHCEGFNLPLLESMAHGVVPVSCIHTAMEDYLDADHAVEIRSRRETPIETGMAGEIARLPFEVDVSDRFDIQLGVRHAREQSPRQRAAMAERARARVVERYGDAASLERIMARLTASPADISHA